VTGAVKDSSRREQEQFRSDKDIPIYTKVFIAVLNRSLYSCLSDAPSVSDKDERCPMWGKTGFCEIKKKYMRNLCPHSCKKYAKRHYTVKYAKPPKRRSPRPKPKPKSIKPTPRPTPPLSEDEKEDLKEALEEYAEEEETRLKEKEEKRKEKDEETVAPLQAPPVLRSEKPSPAPAPAIAQDSLNIDVPSEYEGGTPPSEETKQSRYLCNLCRRGTEAIFKLSFLEISMGHPLQI
jgi:hypothetical protein